MNQQQIKLVKTISADSGYGNSETQNHAKSLLAWSIVFLLSLWIVGCGSDGTSGEPRPNRNTFTDYQHISGYINGVWTKENNPYIITGISKIEDGDSIVLTEGVRLQVSNALEINAGGSLFLRGTPNEPIYVSNGGNIDGYRGQARIKYSLFEGGPSLVTLPFNTVIEHSTFAETGIVFSNIWSEPYDSLVMRDNIFTANNPWDYHFGQIVTLYETCLDSSKTKVDHNIFFTLADDSIPISDPLRAVAESPIIRVQISGKRDTIQYTGAKWPYGLNYFVKPKWEKYRVVGHIPSGFSANDYHLQAGSFGIGISSDGKNIGAF